MLRLKSIICCIVLLSLAFPLGNALAKRAKFDESSVSAINLDVVRVEACARGKGCVIASGPMQVDLLDMAKDNIDYVNQVLLPEKTKRLRLILGDNSTITVDGESFPLTVPSGKTTGLKLWGWRAFPEEGGFLSNLELKLNLKRQIIVRQKRVRRNWRDWNISNNWRENLKSQEINYSYTLKPILRVLSAKTAALSTEDAAAIVAMPDEDSEIMIGDTFSLSIPAGAVSEPMVISVEESKYTVEVLDEETGVVVEKPALSSNYELSPDGAEFDEPLQIVIPYHPDLLPSEVSEYDLAVYLDGEKIPTDINTVSKTATADVWHFSTANVSHSQATGNFVFPFDERDKKWQICQGYNTPTISHGSPKYPSLIHAFDFAYGTGNLGATGCLGNSGGSTNKTIIAPAEGMILWNGSNQKDITCFQLKVAVSNGHGAQIASVKFGHMKSNSDRRSANPKLVIAQKTPIGKLSAPDKFTNGGYAHIHMAAYTTANCTGVTVPFGTVFGSGYDFSSDGSKHQWHGTEIQANGSQSATCPNGDGLYCGSVVSRDANTLYRCTNGAYTVEEQCSNGCKSMPIGQDDKCEDVVVPPPATCPNGDGLYCGSVVSRDANTLYRCTNGVYSVEEQCSNGCEIMSSGTNDQCKSAPATCPSGNGLYCGGTVSRDANTLYRCTNGAYTIEEQCSNGCKGMPIGQDDKCEDVVVPPPATCPSGNGLYCGGTVSRDANTLYRCTNGTYTVEEQCSNGCETMASGTNDQCKVVQATCPDGTGLYCGKSSLNQNTNTLYYCQNGNYSVQEQCSNGCETMASGTNDQCKVVQATCPYGNGLYCGSNSLGQNTNTLYYCQDGNYQVQEQCSNGCEVMDPGVADKCKSATCPSGNGLYCGQSSLNQNTSYLYYCQNGTYNVQKQCSSGCKTMPSGYNDQCN